MKYAFYDFLSILILGTIGLAFTAIPGLVAYNLFSFFPVHPYTPWIAAYICSATSLGWFSIYVYAYITAYNDNDYSNMQ